jgi:hypothetical protein
MKNLWQHANITRVVVLAAIIAFVTFCLVAFLACLGDSDLPPYDPPFPVERAIWVVLGVIAGPVALVARMLGHDPPGVLWLPLLFVAGLFWASLIEVCIALIWRRRA